MEERKLILPILLGLLPHEINHQHPNQNENHTGNHHDLLNLVHRGYIDADRPIPRLTVRNDNELAVGDDRRPALLLAVARVDHGEVLQVVVGAAEPDGDEGQLQGAVGLLGQLGDHAVFVVAL
jgi:hypothetical protein